jgi:outer membrane protein assembly factor BamB
MSSTPVLRRWLSMGGAGVVFAAVLAVVACNRGPTVDPVAADDKAPADKTSADKAPADKAPADKGGKAAEASTWPVWGGTVQRNLVNTFEKNTPTEWNNARGKEQNILWSADMGSKAYGGPTIGNGKIFIGTNNNRPRNKDIRGDKGVLMCFRESDGQFLWQIVRDKLEAGRVNDWPEEGITSAPTIEGNRIWFVTNRCEVVCATTEGLAAGSNVGPYKDEKYHGKTDGDIVWVLDMIKELGVFPHNLATCSPMIIGDVLYVITSNGVDEGHVNIPAPEAPSFIAVDKKTGKVLWTSKLPGRKIMHGQWSNPVFATVQGKPQVIFPGGDGWIYSFTPKGELLWKFDCNPKGSVYRLGGKGTRSDFVSTPIIHDNKLYIGVGQDPEHLKGVGHLWCIDITKTPKNKEKDLSPWSDPRDEAPNKFDPKDPRNKDSALVWHYGGKNPEEEGREYLFCRTLSTCAVKDGLLYTGDFDGYVYCFDAQTGQKYWEYEMGADTWSSPYVVDGKVYFGNENGVMHIFETGKKLKLLKKVQMRGLIRATPVACNGVFYVMTENPCKLWAIKAK